MRAIGRRPYNGRMTSTASTPTDQATAQALSLAVAGRLVDGLAARDFGAVVDAMADDVGFRALLPSRVLDLEGRDAVRTVFERWFAGAERWELAEAVVGEVGGRIYLRWRVRMTDPKIGPDTYLVEQQVYADAGPEGRLCNVALLCTGYCPEMS